jgi:CubicO group peptidase (beta-lactamase class C family)
MSAKCWYIALFKRLTNLLRIQRMMKIKLLVSIALIFCALVAWKFKYISNAPDLLTGFSSKVGCSLRFVSKFSEDQVIRDLLSYSSLISYVDLQFNYDEYSVTSTLLWKEKTAKYNGSRGCVLVHSKGNVSINPTTTSTNTSVEPLFINDLSLLANETVKRLADKDNRNGFDTRAVLILKNSEVIAEYYADGYSSETQFLGWSMAKTFNSVILGNMVNNQLVNPNKKNILRVPSEDPRSKIDMEQLLTMTSGLDFREDYSPGGDAVRMLFSDYSAHERPLLSQIEHQPGSVFSYSSGTANILSDIAFSQFSTKDAAFAYISENILLPLGMTDAVLESDPSGTFVGSSFIYSTARGYARLGQLFIDEGLSVDGVRVVSKEWIGQSTQPNTSQNEKAYGYQVWLNAGNKDGLRWPSLPKNTFAAKGNKGQYIVVIPEMKMVVVRLGWSKEEYPINDFIGGFIEEINF